MITVLETNCGQVVQYDGQGIVILRLKVTMEQLYAKMLQKVSNDYKEIM